MSDVEDPAPDPRDVASPEGAVAAAKESKLKASNARDFWAHALSRPEGRKEIWNLLSEFGAFATPFQIGPNGFPQPDATWFRAGQQALVLGLYHKLVAYDFEAVRLMLVENDPRFRQVK